ncbi:ABC transporter ATP-binding protein [Chthonobacter rhizosphaerae]|uniref:ABC transporter ATP-binding protein n=1 Tax=Chthonobacter rhizosphaerae TaxID=2735553 RepID=UPI0015EFCC72|nr:sn-glycerol-3-phosphate ABC transporter ATP-binding protein UgpC [Chthonobacter rhizosphaerae]
MTDLALRHVGKRFGSHRILTDIDLAIADGEFVVLVGPSGCGKSTLLRMIAGLETISEGDLLIGDRRANDLPPQKRNIAMVFQSYALFPHMTAADNISFGPKIRRDPPAGIDGQVKKAAGILNLHAYLNRYPRQLSGGQRQRVAMGRAIVRDPDVFLFDEPLSNLDAQLRVQMRTEIKALHQRLKSTIVYVTHDQIEAMTMADRIVVMNEGRIVQAGPPLELYDHPAAKFVASFLGSPSMSFVPGTVAAGPDGAGVVTAGGLSLPTRALNPSSAGRPVEVGIRPEHFRIEEGPSALPVTVDVVEPTGSETHIYGSLEGAPIRLVFRDRVAARPGSILPVAADPTRTHVFDQATGLPV